MKNYKTDQKNNRSETSYKTIYVDKKTGRAVKNTGNSCMVFTWLTERRAKEIFQRGDDLLLVFRDGKNNIEWNHNAARINKDYISASLNINDGANGLNRPYSFEKLMEVIKRNAGSIDITIHKMNDELEKHII